MVLIFLLLLSFWVNSASSGICPPQQGSEGQGGANFPGASAWPLVFGVGLYPVVLCRQSQACWGCQHLVHARHSGLWGNSEGPCEAITHVAQVVSGAILQLSQALRRGDRRHRRLGGSYRRLLNSHVFRRRGDLLVLPKR